ncbi:MAG: GNAT family N-acetyltransferase [Paracoccaceae bacterium]
MTTTIHIPTLETERLILRGPQASDLDALAAFLASDRAGFVGGPLGEAESWRTLMRIGGQWVLRGYGMWIIEHRETAQPAGWAGILHYHEWPEPELAYSLFGGFEGQGIAYEAVAAARDGAARLFGITRPISMILPDNTRSIRLAQRLGAVLEGPGQVMDLKVDMWRHQAPEASA